MNIAVITGASSGMGKDTLLLLEKEYQFDEIWAIARREDKLLELQEHCKTKIRAIPLDLSKDESYLAYAKMLEEEKPNVKLLFNCSGFGKFGRIEKVPLVDTLGMIDVNCKGYAAMTEITLPYMRENSQILLLDSLSAFQPVPFMTTYGATKAFVLSYGRALREELKPRKISVMIICPGWITTEFFDRAWQTNDDKVVNYYNKLYTSEQVAKQTIKDLKKGKKMSILGFGNKLQVLGVKIMPVGFVIRTWMRQQGHKNYAKDGK